MLKKLLVLPLIGLFILPAQSAQALTLLDSGADSLIKNMASAESVDFNLDVDFETMNEQLEAPINIHADIDGVFDKDANDALDFSFWMNDGNEFNQSNAHLVSTSDYIFISEDKKTWYFADQLFSKSDAEINTDDITEIESEFGKLLHAGVIKYDPETVDYINNTFTVRYAYELDKEALLDYLESTDKISNNDLSDLRIYLSDSFSVSGNLWVDTIEMLPVMFTLNIENKANKDNYTTLEFTVLFNSFNQSVKVVEPVGALPLEEYEPSQTQELIMNGFQKTIDNIDSDGDGLTDDQEKTLWDSDPFSADSDGDGYDDHTEVINGYDPNGAGKFDSDGDGLTDYAEMTIHWSDPHNSDTDGDSYPDGLEIANGYDPNGPGRF